MPYSLSSDFNGVEVLAANTRARHCSRCGIWTHKWDESIDFYSRPLRMKRDYSSSTDGFDIVSLRFKSVLEAAKVADVEFRRLSDNFFVMRPLITVMLDLSANVPSLNNPRLGKFCEACYRHTGQYAAFYPAEKIYPKIMYGQEKLEGILMRRSCQELAGGKFLSPAVLVSHDLAEIMKSEKLTGVGYMDCLQEGVPQLKASKAPRARYPD